jgi:hypothetical protein
MDLVVNNIPVKDLKNFLNKEDLDRISPTLAPLGPSGETKVLLDLTFFHPAAHPEDRPPLEMVTQGQSLSGASYFEAHSKHKRDKYEALALERGYVLIPMPISVHGGIDPKSCKFIQYLIDAVVQRRFQRQVSNSDLPLREVVQYRSNLSRALWRTFSSNIQRSLVRHVVSVYCGHTQAPCSRGTLEDLDVLV